MQIKVASRKAFGDSLVKLGENPKIVALDADLSKSTNSFAFSQKYPKRFFQMGIAEANMIGVASGLALSGYIPFACSFACFITGRFDQIKMSVAYSGAAVRIVGTHAGVGIGEDGYSQQGLEDIALMRSLPSMEVFQPADDVETASIMDYLIVSKNPAYLRLTRQDLVRVHDDTYQFVAGKFPLLKNGKDISVFATGGTVFNALSAAQELKAQGIDVAVYNASSLKPVDEENIACAVKHSKLLVTIEDHSIIGGLGGAIAEAATAHGLVPSLLRIGIDDEFGESGTPESLYEKHALSKDKIAQRILLEWRRLR
ncbi:MAG: transketolase family protein [Myxococcales bacterium]|nr:transketolase family protein [Myxococcales bacterium]USN49867.1 MAG: transketolase family protein [Myxococcales bacterium]